MSLASQLLGSTRSAVLGVLFLHPETALHVRELARVTGASPGSLHRELRALAELGLLERGEAGRQVYYRANRACPVFEELAGLLRKTSGLADVLRDALAPLADRIAAAFVYGSVAAGREGPRSDVDVMVLGKAGFADVVAALAPVQEVLRRAVNPTVMTPAEFAKRCKASDGFATTLLREPKIWLIGDDHELG
ncbi:MAG: helix-turn-helix domain-containing protein [Rhodocyclaceae bacterium]|nr:helix-turn-helix domain-containing protein [Rhodocyclaceae bacterium]